jgi:hypothetical protein
MGLGGHQIRSGNCGEEKARLGVFMEVNFKYTSNWKKKSLHCP